MDPNKALNMTMLCDFYELTMGNGYLEHDMQDRITYFDVFFRSVPDDGGYAIAAGLEQIIDYIENLHFSDEDIAYLRSRKLFSEAFLDYLKNVLIQTLHKGGIVVMDNMRSHHVKGVEEVLRAAGIIPLYLPPYSPDLNPIEMLWSKMKAILRKLGCNIAVLLPQMVAEALALVSPEDCFGWFTAEGY